jgi:1,4-dihydroxy-6-naphthoate synthase
MKLKLAFSTCPNDTFMFHALVHNLIDTGNYSFDITLGDIEELNEQAVQQLNDISKISFNAYGQLTNQYQILNSGAALGFGNGPLIISKHKIYPDELADVKMAIPGFKTTANLLLSILYPEVKNKKDYLFSDIEEAVLSNEADAGLIIHETRFSYHLRGLKKVVDLGEIWEEKIKLPLPLGGIAIRRDLSEQVKKDIQKLVSDSVKYAMENPQASAEYVKNYARDLNDGVIRKHIELYVNEYSINFKPDGKSAIEFLVQKASEVTNNKITQPIFL